MADTNDAPLKECSELVRTGRDGRQRYSEDYKRQVLKAFDASGMSGKAFAAHCGVKYPTFASWLAKRRRASSPADASEADPGAAAFLLAEISEGCNALELTLPGGITAGATTAGQARLLAALNSGSISRKSPGLARTSSGTSSSSMMDCGIRDHQAVWPLRFHLAFFCSS